MSAALLVVWTVAAPPDPAPPMMTLAVDLAGLDSETHASIAASGLYKNLLVRVVGEELAFVDRPEQADIVVRLLGAGPGSIRIRVTTSVREVERTVDIGEADPAARELALTHAVLDVVRTARGELAAARADLAQGVASTPAPSTWRASARAGAVFLIGPGDGAMFELAAGIAKAALSLTLGVAASLPFGLPGELTIFEWGPCAGARYAIAFTDWLEAGAGVDAGFWLSHYTYTESAQVADAGTQIDALGLLRADLSVLLLPSLRAGVQGGILATLGARQHRGPGGVLWRAAAVRPFVGASLAYTHLQ